MDIDPSSQVRLLINDTDDAAPLFSDVEILMFLALEAQSVKRAAAQALDVIASNETLVAKVIRDHEITSDGPAVAADLRKHAAALRQEALDDEARAGGDAYFEFITPDHCHTDPYCW